MRFVRVTISHTQNRVIAVTEQDVPFGHGGAITVIGEECETIDLGVVEECHWTDLAGHPCTPSRHVYVRLEIDHAGMPKIHDVPCTVGGIKDRLRAGGLQAVPIKVRAWLATVLPPDQVAALGIGRGLPISALKACEAIRVGRDPAEGSRMAYFEAIAHRQAVRRSARALAKRETRAARAAKRATPKD